MEKCSENLPNEIVAEILARLSVKCLKKLQCVCKEWRDLITSQHFTYLHLDHPSRQKTNGAADYLVLAQKDHEIRSTWDPDSFLSFYSLSEDGVLARTAAPRNLLPSFPSSYENLRVDHVFGPCNGIIGLVVTYEEDREDKEAIYLCNPATGESRRLPHRTLDTVQGAQCFGTCACGLGFDPRTKEYKVVSILFYSFRDSDYYTMCGFYRMGIYCSSSDTWKEVDLHLPDTMQAPKRGSNINMYYGSWVGSGVLMKGRLHWLVNKETIVYLDISSEIMGQLPCPDVIKNVSRHIALVEDSLALMEVSEAGMEEVDSDPCSVLVWKMVAYGESASWRKRISFTFCVGNNYGFWRILCWDNELLVFGPRFLVSVNIVESQMKKYQLVGDDCLKTYKPLEEVAKEGLVANFQYHWLVAGAVIVCGESLVRLG